MPPLTLITTDLAVCDCCQQEPSITDRKSGCFYVELCRECCDDWDVQMATVRRTRRAGR